MGMEEGDMLGMLCGLWDEGGDADGMVGWGVWERRRGKTGMGLFAGCWDARDAVGMGDAVRILPETGRSLGMGRWMGDGDGESVG